MKRTLLLNGDWTPLNFISSERAMLLVFKERAEIITNMAGDKSVWNDASFTTTSATFDVPATIKLNRRIHRHCKPARFRKKVLFNRDGWKCQYCGMKLNIDTATIDHVIPSSKGGRTTWLNCVAACKPCNKRKANRLLADCDLTLAKMPANPHPLHFWNISKSSAWHDDWRLFLDNVY